MSPVRIKSEKHFTPTEDPLDEEFETTYREVRIALSEKEEAKKEALKSIYKKKKGAQLRCTLHIYFLSKWRRIKNSAIIPRVIYTTFDIYTT